MGENTSAARAEVLASRAALEEELVRLEASARASVDIPSKVKRNPVKAAGLAAGVGFVVIGGPRKVLRGAKRAIMGPPEPLPKAMLPDEIEKALKRMGGDGVKVRGLLEREFADYLTTTEKARKSRDLPLAVTATLLTAARPFVLQAARRLATQALSPDAGSFGDQVEKIRTRRALAEAEAAAARAEADALKEAEEELSGI